MQFRPAYLKLRGMHSSGNTVGSDSNNSALFLLALRVKLPFRVQDEGIAGMNAPSEKILNASVCLFTINNFLRVPQSGSVFLKPGRRQESTAPASQSMFPQGRTDTRRSVLTLLHRSNKHPNILLRQKSAPCRTFSRTAERFSLPK